MPASRAYPCCKINRGNQYGPRFYFDGFPLLVILAAAIFGTTRYEDRSRQAPAHNASSSAVLAHVAVAATLLQAAHAQIRRRDLQYRVAASSLSHALVFVTPIGVGEHYVGLHAKRDRLQRARDLRAGSRQLNAAA